MSTGTDDRPRTRPPTYGFLYALLDVDWDTRGRPSTNRPLPEPAALALLHCVDERLPVTHRQVLLGVFLRGLSLNDLRRQTGLSRHRVRMLRGDAVRRLQTEPVFRAIVEAAPADERGPILEMVAARFPSIAGRIADHVDFGDCGRHALLPLLESPRQSAREVGQAILRSVLQDPSARASTESPA